MRHLNYKQKTESRKKRNYLHTLCTTSTNPYFGRTFIHRNCVYCTRYVYYENLKNFYLSAVCILMTTDCTFMF